MTSNSVSPGVTQPRCLQHLRQRRDRVLLTLRSAEQHEEGQEAAEVWAVSHWMRREERSERMNEWTSSTANISSSPSSWLLCHLVVPWYYWYIHLMSFEIKKSLKKKSGFPNVDTIFIDRPDWLHWTPMNPDCRWKSEVMNFLTLIITYSLVKHELKILSQSASDTEEPQNRREIRRQVQFTPCHHWGRRPLVAPADISSYPDKVNAVVWSNTINSPISERLEWKQTWYHFRWILKCRWTENIDCCYSDFLKTCRINKNLPSLLLLRRLWCSGFALVEIIQVFFLVQTFIFFIPKGNSVNWYQLNLT